MLLKDLCVKKIDKVYIVCQQDTLLYSDWFENWLFQSFCYLHTLTETSVSPGSCFADGDLLLATIAPI